MTLASWFSGHSFKLEAEDFILHIPQRSFPNFGLKILVLCSARTLWSFYFSLFCSQLVYTCSKFGYSNPKMKIVFFFFYSQVAYNCSNYIIKTRSYLSKMSLLTNNKAPLVFWANQFFQSNNIQKNKTKTKQKESFVELKNT